MKIQRLSFVFVMMLFSSSVLFSGCHSKEANKQPKTQNPKLKTNSYYTCSMHTQIHKDKPGNCPICGMKLLKVSPSSNKDTTTLDSSLSYLTQPVTKTVVGSFKVIEPEEMKLQDTITAEGSIGFDKRDLNTVNTRITGRIEKLNVRYTHQQIHKGQPLMEIYSPELLSAQRNLLQAMQDKDSTLIRSLKAQLVNLGMQMTEIQKVMEDRQPLTRIRIYSPYNGISQQTQGMASLKNVSYTSPGNGTELLNIREGMYVNRGQTVFSIQNTARTWAILYVFTADIRHIHPGDAVSLYTDADPDNSIKGQVDFIPPYRSQDGKTTAVRIYLEHLPAHWKIGTLIHGQIAISKQSKDLYIPLSAVNRLGMKKVVWAQDKQHHHVFHATQVQTGRQTDASIQIISGIKSGDQIVKNAAYMVGSDSFIQ